MPVAASPFILPRGVTGFDDQRVPPKPHDLLKELKALGHEVARQTRGRILGGAAGGLVGDNFHRLHLEGRDFRVVVLLNAFHPLVGFAKTDASEPIFTDIPDGFLSRDQGLFTFIGKAILSSPPDRASLSALAEAEIRQMDYWRPRRLGDIIFNHWD